MDINILHLSDLHFGLQLKKEENQTDIKNHKNVIKSFFLKLSQDEVKNLNPDFIIVSGDITNEALLSEFEEARKFIVELINFFPKINFSKILFVPGNHDKKRHEDFPSIERLELFNALKKSCIPSTKPKTAEERRLALLFNGIEESSLFLDIDGIKKRYDNDRRSLFNSATNIDSYCRKRFKEYSSFVKPFYSLEPNKFIPIKIGGKILKNNLVSVVHYEYQDEDIDVVFILLNSAWLCESSKRDPGKLSLGNPIIDSIKDEIEALNRNKANLVITVMHHCPNSFHWSDIHDNGLHMSNLAAISEFSTLIVSGHEHGKHLEKPDFVDNEAQLLTSGTFYPGKNGNYSCSFYRIDTLEKRVAIRNIKLDNDLTTGGRYNWIIENEFIYPLTKASDLMNRNRDLMKRNTELVAENKELNWFLSKPRG